MPMAATRANVPISGNQPVIIGSNSGYILSLIHICPINETLRVTLYMIVFGWLPILILVTYFPVFSMWLPGLILGVH